MTAASRTRFSE
ncbi:uncharacterized protein CELE_C02C6.14 [Caenorhabditis elegans]|uniref:Uncharacterized protein n=1 Tax=Caenorhabditis elegans TaxID=6239 RepID=A0A2K5ATZ3_CAEEL|nr:Uncharacterized protein CELE_C02C6.14 [Caenorhabditis elegans]SPC48643.1 Uncharacterized protein CELE_C02C6.14 [Caenorhabditis elegans]|eukprot:NP_001348782.1 Uncharacterized protein CELE_C02C6.14 [Caenorhabditis elegans]